MNTTEAIVALSALSQETRLDVFRMLVKAGPEGVPAGVIAERLDVRQNTLSTHLGILRVAGLLKKRRHSRTIFYTAHYDGMRALLAYLLEDCCGGEQAICGPLLETISCAC